jgi:uncharacterized protein
MKFLLMLLTLLPLLAWSASFDCQKARSATEKMVCADPELSKLDEQLAQTYHGALKTLASQVKAEQIGSNAPAKLTQEQKHWVTYVRNLCTDIACLRETYQSRIKLLERDPNPFTNLYPTTFITPKNELGLTDTRAVVYPRDSSEEIIKFIKILARSKTSGKIINCSKIIDLLPPNDSEVDYGIAGICTIENNNKIRTLIQICYENINGHHAIKTIDKPDVSYEALAYFIYNQCMGSSD